MARLTSIALMAAVAHCGPQGGVLLDESDTSSQAALLPGNLLPGNLLPGNLLPGNLLPGNLLPGNSIPGGGGVMNTDTQMVSMILQNQQTWNDYLSYPLTCAALNAIPSLAQAIVFNTIDSDIVLPHLWQVEKPAGHDLACEVSSGGVTKKVFAYGLMGFAPSHNVGPISQSDLNHTFLMIGAMNNNAYAYNLTSDGFGVRNMLSVHTTSTIPQAMPGTESANVRTWEYYRAGHELVQSVNTNACPTGTNFLTNALPATRNCGAVLGEAFAVIGASATIRIENGCAAYNNGSQLNRRVVIGLGRGVEAVDFVPSASARFTDLVTSSYSPGAGCLANSARIEITLPPGTYNYIWRPFYQSEIAGWSATTRPKFSVTKVSGTGSLSFSELGTHRIREVSLFTNGNIEFPTIAAKCEYRGFLDTKGKWGHRRCLTADQSSCTACAPGAGTLYPALWGALDAHYSSYASAILNSRSCSSGGICMWNKVSVPTESACSVNEQATGYGNATSCKASAGDLPATDVLTVKLSHACAGVGPVILGAGPSAVAAPTKCGWN